MPSEPAGPVKQPIQTRPHQVVTIERVMAIRAIERLGAFGERRQQIAEVRVA